MSDHIYKTVELTGSSTRSIQEAIENAIARAAQTVHNLRWFQVIDTRGHIERGKVAHWQVTLKIGFTLDEIVDQPKRKVAASRSRKKQS